MSVRIPFRFTVHLTPEGLEKSFQPSYSEFHGPFFHRWLPDGEKDAIVLDEVNEMKVWFKRFGFVEDGFIQFDHTYKRQEVDPGIMARQAVHQAGPLFGSLTAPAQQSELLAIQEKREDADYKQLAERVIHSIVGPVNSFLVVLRTEYGQYWIPRIERWDSRVQSLGHYCRSLNITFSLDDRKTWQKLAPTKSELRFALTIESGHFKDYISQTDWRSLQNRKFLGADSNQAAELLAQAHRFLDQGVLKFALIESTVALEMAISDWTRTKFADNKILSTAAQAFRDINLKARMVIALPSSVSEQDRENALKCIDLRNSVVHEGGDLFPESRDVIRALFRVVAALLPGSEHRFPTGRPGNQLDAEKKGEQASQNAETVG